MLSDENYDDLKVKGYTVVPDVLTHTECDSAIAEYQDWLSQFKDGEWPYSRNSLIQNYNTGHMHPTWFVRLKAKHVFTQIWKTDKLLTSFDAIAIGRPPEDGQEDFQITGKHWLHLDQEPKRHGLHAYQGAVNLEETEVDDWTLEVMEGSHLHFETFYGQNPKANMLASVHEFYALLDEEVLNLKAIYEIKRIPVPKGGIVLWDSRLVHANARPRQGRKNPGRWRFCVFVSMTPAIWASKDDIEIKRSAYNEALMTSHWSSQGVRLFDTRVPPVSPENVTYPSAVPDIAKSREAQMLAGVVPYDFKDGNSTGEELKPKWKDDCYGGFNKKKHSVVFHV